MHEDLPLKKLPVNDSDIAQSEKSKPFITLDWKDILSFAKESTNKIAEEIASTAKGLSNKLSAASSEFQKVQSVFETDKNNEVDVLSSKPYQQLPWHPDVTGLNKTDSQLLKEKILAISADRRHFLQSPPKGTSFQWTEKTSKLYLITAECILKEDENLRKMRFELVPRRINENHFWRNYFYKISLIRMSAQLADPSLKQAKSSACSDDPSDFDEIEAELLLEVDSNQNGSSPYSSLETLDYVIPDDMQGKDLEREIIAELEMEEANVAAPKS